MKRFFLIVCACILVVFSFFCGCSGAEDNGGEGSGYAVSDDSSSDDKSEDLRTDETLGETGSSDETAETETEPSENRSDEIDTAANIVFDVASVNYEYTQVDDSYFDDAVFIGDSISYGLELYVTGKRAGGETVFGNGVFLTSGSLSYGNSLWDVSDQSVHPSYMGTKMKLEDAVAQIKPKKIYILLGTNDVALYGVDQTVLNADTEINRMLEASPEAEIFILSTTPKYTPAQSGVEGELNNSLIDQLNRAMSLYASEKGYNYLYFAPLFKDETGGLASDYCSDKENMGIHFTNAAYDIWIDFLYSHGKLQS